MKLVISKSYEEGARRVASHIAAAVQKRKDLLLGLATGSTPVPVYRCLAEGNARGEIDFSEARVVNLDEYVGLAKDHPNSYHRFMRENLLDAVGIPDSRFTIPRGDAPLEEELARLNAFAAQNPIDLQLLGVGANGHIGFNEPDTIFPDGYHAVTLAQGTIQDNARFFDNPESVPTMAITMGIGTIMRAGEIILLASGENKREAMRALLEEGDVTPAVPVTALKLHGNCTIYLDEALAKDIAVAPYITVE